MDFTFEEKPGVEICGKKYGVDISDVGFLTGIVTSFPALFSIYDEFVSLQKRVLAKGTKGGEMRELADKVQNKNRELYEQAREFIIGCIGEEGYREVFRSRTPNSAEHVQVCAHIYREVLRQREAVLRPYLNPPLESGE